MAVPPTADPFSTIRSAAGDELDEGSHPIALWIRRGMLTAMALVVAAGLAGLLGVHTSSVSSRSNGYDLTLHYPAVARAGLDTEWQVTVTHPGGFGKQLTLAVSGDYFNIFETQGFHPNPSQETRDGQNLYLTFTAPPGGVFVLDFDTYIQPSSQKGSTATVSVVKNSSFTTAVASVHIETRLMP